MRELNREEICQVSGGNSTDDWYNGWAAPWIYNQPAPLPIDPFQSLN